MNEEEDELHQKEMEERLYGSIHHGSEDVYNQEMNNEVYTADTSNNNRMRSNLKRYFQHMNKTYPTNNRSFKPKKNQGNNVNEQEIPEEPPMQAAKKFVPYVPILARFTAEEEQQETSKATQKKKFKKFINPTNPLNQRKIAMMHKIQEKKIKAESSKAKSVASGVVDLVSSDEDFEENPNVEEEKEDGDDTDDVIVIPVAPPPLVVIQSSDDDEENNKFASPKSSNSPYEKKRNVRCGSHSGSSLMSDDFIGQADKRRLQQENLNMSNIGCDENAMTVESVLHPSDNDDLNQKSIDESRFIRPQQTETAKHSSELETHSECSNSSDFPRGLRVVTKALPKTPKPAEKKQEDDSIYSVKGNFEEQEKLKSRKMSKRRKSIGNKSTTDNPSSSSDSEDNNVQSKSAYNSDASSKSKKKIRRKRKKFDSEHYSDEDFRNILTNIVNAESSGGGEESNDESGNNLTLGKESKNSDIEEVPVELNTISLPQITINDEPDTYFEIMEQGADDVQSLSDASEDQVRAKWNQEINWNDPEITWNHEMKKFYNESWDCEDFNVSTVAFNMPRSSKDWSIIDKDKYPDPPKSGPVCYNCNIYGHTKFKCPQKKKPISCPICGYQGHTEPRCPYTICLKCGARTSTFLKECKNCAFEKNIFCHSCHVKGHASKNCPDKWRRFHNTIKDNEQLNTHIVFNPNSRQCSICTKQGHEAHKCNNALQIFGCAPQSSQVKSHTPVYHPMEWGDKPDNKYSFCTFSDLVNFDFKFDKNITKTENGFYNRFARATGLDKFQEKEKQMKRKLSGKKLKKNKKIKNEPSEKKVDKINEESINETTENEVKSSQEGSNLLDQSLMTIDSVHSENVHNLDFIPLMSSDRPQPNVKTDAKIYLSKIHSKILLGLKGSDFLKEKAKKYDLKLSISFEKIGNVLVVFGTSKSQDQFHAELVNYLNENEKQLNEMKIINQVPKAPSKTINFIQQHLDLLKKNHGKVQDLYKRLLHFEGGNNPKPVEKVRRNLNMLLFGQLKLKDGGLHLDGLIENIKTLETTNDQTISNEFREEIFQHIKYIFTGYDHSNYDEIVDEYVKNQKRTDAANQMATQVPIKSDIILNVAKPMSRNQADYNLFFAPEESNRTNFGNRNRSNNDGPIRLNFDNNRNNNNGNGQNRSNFDNNRPNFDNNNGNGQNRLNFNNNRPNFDNNRNNNNGNGSNFNNNRPNFDNNQNNFNKFGNWQSKLPKMLQECRYLATQVNSRALAEKFNRTFSYMEVSGGSSFQNFKQLCSILTTLKGHVYQNDKGN